MMILLLPGKEWAIKLDKKYFLICYLKDKYKVMVVFCGLIICNVFMYFLYDVRMEPILYTTFLLILLVLPFAFRDLRNTYQKCERLNNIKQAKLPAMPNLGAADTLVEESYALEDSVCPEAALFPPGGSVLRLMAFPSVLALDGVGGEALGHEGDIEPVHSSAPPIPSQAPWTAPPP